MNVSSLLVVHSPETKCKAQDPGRQRIDFGVLNSWAGNRGGGLVPAMENIKRLQNFQTKNEMAGCNSTYYI